MTKNEAAKMLYASLMAGINPSTQVNSFVWCQALISGLKRLGMIKLEEDAPIHDPVQALASAMSSARDEGSGALTAARVNAFLERYGFQVVRAAVRFPGGEG